MTRFSVLARLSMACLAGACLLLQGCTNTVKYDQAPASETITNRISKDELSQITAKMLDQMLADSKVKSATKAVRPMLAVFGVIDFTADNIDLAALNGAIYSQLSDSSRFRFTDANALSRKSAELNLNLYDLLEDPKTTQKLAKPLDADYLLVGEISNVIRTQPKAKLVYYRVSLKLLDSKQGRFLWQQQQEIQKSEKAIIYGI